MFTASYVSKRKWDFYIEALEQYPNQCGSWIISGVQCVPVNAILCVLPQAGTLAEHIYKPDQIVRTTSLTQLNNGVSICVCSCVCVKCVCCCVHFGYICTCYFKKRIKCMHACVLMTTMHML